MVLPAVKRLTKDVVGRTRGDDGREVARAEPGLRLWPIAQLGSLRVSYIILQFREAALEETRARDAAGKRCLPFVRVNRSSVRINIWFAAGAEFVRQ